MSPSLSSLVAAIPSPSSGAIHIGDLQLRAYGLMIALGAIAAVWLAGRRLEASGAGKRDDMSAIAMWAVPAGVVGARIYHVITDWKSFRGDWLRAFKIWEGGLGIWGGIALGTVVGLWAASRRGISTAAVLRAATPALPLGQAIARWGNWWNQELFGKPTDLPWALKIDEPFRPAIYRDQPTFHPVFLYESLWNALLCVVLIKVDRRYKLRSGRLFALYVAGYTFWRFWLERLRVDPASKIAGLRVNEWVSVVVFAVALGYFFLGPKTVVDGGAAADGDGSGDDGDGDGAGGPAADVGGDPEVTSALGAYAYDGSVGAAEPTPARPKVVHKIANVGGDPEVSAVLGKYAFDASFGEVPSYDPRLHQPEPEAPAAAAEDGAADDAAGDTAGDEPPAERA